MRVVGLRRMKLANKIFPKTAKTAKTEANRQKRSKTAENGENDGIRPAAYCGRVNSKVDNGVHHLSLVCRALIFGCFLWHLTLQLLTADLS